MAATIETADRWGVVAKTPKVDAVCDAVADTLRANLPELPTGATAAAVEVADVPSDPNELTDGEARVYVSWESTAPDHIEARKTFEVGITLMERHSSGRLPPLAWRRSRVAWFDKLLGTLTGERPLNLRVTAADAIGFVKDELRSGVLWLAAVVQVGDTAPLHRPTPRGG